MRNHFGFEMGNILVVVLAGDEDLFEPGLGYGTTATRVGARQDIAHKYVPLVLHTCQKETDS